MSAISHQFERLAWEGTAVELSLLEKSLLLIDHPVVISIRHRLYEEKNPEICHPLCYNLISYQY
ncbi:hypothetical protein [Candidatus Lokiarchaeum ossiferum]|uniref:hypothetical protein n=1 Tax=Candidatus Lokiarchaeum ossiferum TaxID=2951803 RepID=UPI00352DE29C